MISSFMNDNECKNNSQSSSGTTELCNLSLVTSPLWAHLRNEGSELYDPEALFGSQFYLVISDQLAL